MASIVRGRMREPNFEPEMVGLEKELRELRAYPDKAIDGKVNRVSISGETCIENTKLAIEVKDNTRVLSYSEGR